MPEIEYVKNITAACNFSAAAGEFSVPVTGIPNMNPDQAIIRAINWNGEAEDDYLYLVWCNLTNDFIASFCGGSLAPHFPQTVIQLNAPIPNMLEFKLYSVLGGTNKVFLTQVTGDLSIHLDLMKYKRTPVHA